MKTESRILSCVGIAVAFLVGFLIGYRWLGNDPGLPLEPRVDTLVIHDTIKVTEPISVTRRVVDSVLVPVADTIKMRDTLFVYLERQQVRWEDSLAVVYASGINPQVDSVIHFSQDMIITREIPVVQARRARWGLGVQAGVGAGKNGLTPYVGVGVSYNILSW